MNFSNLFYKGTKVSPPNIQTSGVIYYSWISYSIPTVGFKPKKTSENKIYCAWCNKPRSEIKNPKRHIQYHYYKEKQK